MIWNAIPADLFYLHPFKSWADHPGSSLLLTPQFILKFCVVLKMHKTYQTHQCIKNLQSLIPWVSLSLTSFIILDILAKYRISSELATYVLFHTYVSTTVDSPAWQPLSILSDSGERVILLGTQTQMLRLEFNSKLVSPGCH